MNKMKKSKKIETKNCIHTVGDPIQQYLLIMMEYISDINALSVAI